MRTVATRNDNRDNIFVTLMGKCQKIARDPSSSSDELIKRIQEELRSKGSKCGYNSRLPRNRGSFLSTCSPCSFRSVFGGVPEISTMQPNEVSALLRKRLDSCMKEATPEVLHGEEWRDAIVEGEEGEELRGTTLARGLQWPQVSNLGRYRDAWGVVTKPIRNTTGRSSPTISPIRLGGLLSYSEPYEFGAPIPPVTPLTA